MKKFMVMTVMSVAALGLAACGGKDDGAKAAVDNNVVEGYTKADFMEACKAGMTETQCNCYVDFYGSIGLEVTDLGDQAKVQAAVTSLKPEQTMKMMECMQ